VTAVLTVSNCNTDVLMYVVDIESGPHLCLCVASVIG